MNTRRKGARLTAAALAGTLLVTAACGGDDDTATDTATDTADDTTADDTTADTAGGPAPGSLDDAAFCARLESLEDEFDDDVDDDFGPEAFAALAALADAAPDPGVRDALLRFGEIARELDGLDEDDPAAFGIALGIMFDPEFLQSMEYLERYLVDVCGFDDAGFGMDDGFDDGFDGGFDMGLDITFDEDAYDTLWDDFSLMRDPIEERLGATVSSIGTSRFMGPPMIFVDVDTTSIDPLEACQVAADVFDELLSADGLPVEVRDADFEIVAERAPGDVCELS